MRRTSVLVVMLALLSFGLVLPTAQAAPSPEGALRASFQAGFTGGNGVAYASFAHDSMALFHAANEGLASHERLERIVISPEPWSVDNGCLTPTMKIKRSRIEATIASRIDDWYARPGPVVWA